MEDALIKVSNKVQIPHLLNYHVSRKYFTCHIWNSIILPEIAWVSNKLLAILAKSFSFFKKIKLVGFMYYFPGGTSGKEICLPLQEKQEMWVDRWVKKIPWRRKIATHSSILAWENPWTRGAWQATVHGVSKSQTWQSNWVHMYYLGFPIALSIWKITSIL